MGKERIKNTFTSNKKRLSLYHTAGYPQLDAMMDAVKAMNDSGCDFVELGMPYSDPLADGPTIQESSTIALSNGITLDLYFEQVATCRELTGMPFFFMGYFNQVLRYGIDRFLTKCVEVGIDGLIIPDLPPDVYVAQYQSIFEAYDLGMVFLITPTCNDERIRLIDSLSTGFVYVVSSSSTTGKTSGFNQEQLDYFRRIQSLSLSSPTVVGFGLSSHASFEQVNEFTDGAIIGSAYIKHIADGNISERTKSFVKTIIQG